MEASYRNIFNDLDGARIEGRLETVTQRQKEIQKIHSTIQAHEVELIEALKNDVQWNEVDCLLELATVLQSLRILFISMDIKISVANEHLIATTKEPLTREKPLGNVLIVADAASPIAQSVVPLCLAIAEGNTALVVLPHDVPQTSARLLEIIETSVDRDAIRAVKPESRTEFSQMLHTFSTMPFHAIVAQTAAARAEVETLSFRQVSPDIRIIFNPPRQSSVIITRNADIPRAARDVAQAKFSFYSGKSLTAPGLVLVDEFVLDDFVKNLENAIRAICANRPPGMKRRKYNMTSDTADVISYFLKGAGGKGGKAVQINPETSGETLLIGGPNWNIESFFKQHENELQQKWGYRDPALAILPTSSMEAVITILNNANERELPSSVQVFGNAKEARYLSLFLPCTSTYINHVPQETAFCHYPPSEILSLRPLFAQSQSIHVSQSSSTPSAKQLQEAIASGRGKKDGLKELVAQILAPPIQKAGKQVGFFPQGGMVAVGHVLVLLSLSMTGLVWGVRSYIKG